MIRISDKLIITTYSKYFHDFRGSIRSKNNHCVVIRYLLNKLRKDKPIDKYRSTTYRSIYISNNHIRTAIDLYNLNEVIDSDSDDQSSVHIEYKILPTFSFNPTIEFYTGPTIDAPTKINVKSNYDIHNIRYDEWIEKKYELVQNMIFDLKDPIKSTLVESLTFHYKQAHLDLDFDYRDVVPVNTKPLIPVSF